MVPDNGELGTYSPNHGSGSKEETKGDLLESSEVNSSTTKRGIDLRCHGYDEMRGRTAGYRLTRISQMGMKRIKAKGSKFDKTSLGTPWVLMTAACEVMLLVNWL